MGPQESDLRMICRIACHGSGGVVTPFWPTAEAGRTEDERRALRAFVNSRELLRQAGSRCELVGSPRESLGRPLAVRRAKLAPVE